MTRELYWQPLGFLLQTIPPALMGIYIFKNTLWLSWKKTCIILLSALTAMAAMFFARICYGETFGDEQIYVSANQIFFLCLALCWILFAYLVKAIRKQKVFVFMLLLNYSCLVVYLTNILSGMFPFYERGIDVLPYSGPWLLCHALVSAVAGPVFYHLVGKRSLSGILALASRFWYFLLAIQVVYFMTALIIQFLNGILLEQRDVTVFLASLFFTEFAFYGVTFHMLEILDNYLKMELDKKRAEHELSIQKLQYDRIRESIEITRRARHDLEHHFGVLRMLSQEEENMPKIRDYLDNCLAVRTKIESLELCRNYIVNAVLNYYVQQANEQEIRSELFVALPEDLPFDDAHLSIVFGNSMKNALEACEICMEKGKDAWIKLRARVIQQALVIRVQNSCVGEVKRDENGWISTAHHGYGVGISSMEAVAAHYGGDVKVACRDGVFTLDILLFLPGEQSDLS